MRVKKPAISLRRAIGIFAMREVADAGKHREIEIGKGLAEPIGPGVGKQRIVLGPAHAGRHRDRRQGRRLALHHLDPAGMGGACNAQSRRRDCLAFRKLSVKASITSSNASLRCDQLLRKCAM